MNDKIIDPVMDRLLTIAGMYARIYKYLNICLYLLYTFYAYVK